MFFYNPGTISGQMSRLCEPNLGSVEVRRIVVVSVLVSLSITGCNSSSSDSGVEVQKCGMYQIHDGVLYGVKGDNYSFVREATDEDYLNPKYCQFDTPPGG